jgi:lambda family phage tail tape measure protein
MTEDIRLVAGLDTSGVAAGQRAIVRSFDEIKQSATAMSGSVGASVLGFARSFLATTLSVGAVTLAFNRASTAAMEAERAQVRLTSVLKATGQAAGVTADDVNTLAERMAKTTLFDDESVRNAAANLLTFRSIAGDTFTDTLKVAADLASFMGTEIPQAAMLLGRALEDPTTAVESLRRARIRLTDEEARAIQVSAAFGREAEARTLTLDALRSRVGDVATEMNTGLVGAFRTAEKAAGEFFEAVGQTKVFDDYTKAVKNSSTEIFNAMETAVRAADARARNGGEFFTELAKAAIDGFKNALIDGARGELPQATEELVKALVTGADKYFADTNWVDLGIKLVRSLSDGFDQGTGQLLEVVKKAMSQVLDVVKDYTFQSGKAVQDMLAAKEFKTQPFVLGAPGAPKTAEELLNRAPNRQPGVGSVTPSADLPILPKYNNPANEPVDYYPRGNSYADRYADDRSGGRAGRAVTLPMPPQARPGLTEIERETEAAKARAEYQRRIAGAAGGGAGAVASSQAQYAVFQAFLNRAKGDVAAARREMEDPRNKSYADAVRAEAMAGAGAGDASQLRNLRLSVETAKLLADEVGKGRDAEREAQIAVEARREAANSAFLTEKDLLPFIRARVEAEREAELRRGVRDLKEEVELTRMRAEAELQGGDAVEKINVELRLRQTFTENELKANGEIVQAYREQLVALERITATERERGQARSYGSQSIAQQDLERAKKDIQNLQDKGLLTSSEANRARIDEEIKSLDRATDAWSGVRRAAMRYYQDATNDAANFERLFNTGMNALEDQIGRFVDTGKFEFKDLFKTILKEWLAMESRILASKLLQLGGLTDGGKSSSGGAGGIGGLIGGIAGLFGGGGGGLFGYGGLFGSSGPDLSWLPAGGGGLYANGGAFDVIPFARGGTVVNKPTYFPMSGGRFGKAGEAGAEAILPLQMTSDGKMGVSANIGGRGSSRSVVFNIDARGSSLGVEKKIRSQILQSLPMISERVLNDSAAEADRGGTYAEAMGRRRRS